VINHGDFFFLLPYRLQRADELYFKPVAEGHFSKDR
jgi:hypothetical protein